MYPNKTQHMEKTWKRFFFVWNYWTIEFHFFFFLIVLRYISYLDCANCRCDLDISVKCLVKLKNCRWHVLFNRISCQHVAGGNSCRVRAFDNRKTAPGLGRPRRVDRTPKRAQVAVMILAKNESDKVKFRKKTHFFLNHKTPSGIESKSKNL